LRIVITGLDPVIHGAAPPKALFSETARRGIDPSRTGE
jgi:hypothetical protein